MNASLNQIEKGVLHLIHISDVRQLSADLVRAREGVSKTNLLNWTKNPTIPRYRLDSASQDFTSRQPNPYQVAPRELDHAIAHLKELKLIRQHKVAKKIKRGVYFDITKQGLAELQELDILPDQESIKLHQKYRMNRKTPRTPPSIFASAPEEAAADNASPSDEKPTKDDAAWVRGHSENLLPRSTLESPAAGLMHEKLRAPKKDEPPQR